MKEKTDREKIEEILRSRSATARDISQYMGMEESRVFEELRHIKEGLDDDNLLAVPPKCRKCGFSDFDNILSNPTKCPNCPSEALTMPEFKID